mmetsp:Transcript_23487/g.73240  ORF Transcript_23487/g.73240 Transcript_23487/m.73240 type:complete len:319 (+) Transcript_23487:660-1616(+)
MVAPCQRRVPGHLLRRARRAHPAEGQGRAVRRQEQQAVADIRPDMRRPGNSGLPRLLLDPGPRRGPARVAPRGCQRFAHRAQAPGAQGGQRRQPAPPRPHADQTVAHSPHHPHARPSVQLRQAAAHHDELVRLDPEPHLHPLLRHGHRDHEPRQPWLPRRVRGRRDLAEGQLVLRGRPEVALHALPADHGRGLVGRAEPHGGLDARVPGILHCLHRVHVLDHAQPPDRRGLGDHDLGLRHEEEAGGPGPGAPEAQLLNLPLCGVREGGHRREPRAGQGGVRAPHDPAADEAVHEGARHPPAGHRPPPGLGHLRHRRVG